MENDTAGPFTFWLLDTRDLWNTGRITETAQEALQLLSTDEQRSVTDKHWLKDAKTSLGSALLKRAFVRHSVHVPWRTIRFSRKGDPRHGKPAYVPSSIAHQAPRTMDFNVSHQASLVALAGSSDGSVDFGVDIVCVNERDDYRGIKEEGLDGWVDTFTEVFSDGELWDMKYTLHPDTELTLSDGRPLAVEELGRGDRCCRLNETLKVRLENGSGGVISSRVVIEAKLRRFYAFWCLKEAYVKLVGEALLAMWLRQLEFRNVRAPRPAADGARWGERVTDIEIWLYGEKVEDVKIELQAYEHDYIIGTAWKSDNGAGLTQLRLRPEYHMVDLERDIYPFANG